MARGMLRRFRRNNRLPQDRETSRIRYEQTLNTMMQKTVVYNNM